MSDSLNAVSRALLSVSDKRGIVEFAERLAARGVEILSTGGTANVLRAQDISVTGVADYTGFPEILDGRVKTLHPKIHAGLLGRPGVDDEAFAAHELDHIELLVVNLYPFGKTVARPDCTREEAIEQIDIGGPAMLRAAAKNHRWVIAVVDPDDYPKVATEIEARGGVSEATRRRLACKAFRHTAEYDTAVADYLLAQEQSEDPTPFGEVLDLEMRRRDELRYGENPHQGAAFYVERTAREPSVSTAAQIQGKALSFNNIADADAALECVKQFEQPACVIVKHANPCGVAVADDVLGAYKRAYSADPKSAFGGIIALNRALDANTAAEILNRQFVEVIIAPAVGEDAREALASKRNVRVLETGIWEGEPAPSLDYRRVRGGMLVQDTDLGRIDRDDLEVATRRAPTEQEIDDLLFAWRVVKFVKSNAIVYVRERMSVGIGAGQMSRVYSARIGAEKAAEEGLTLRGAAMASDAFFPFRDSIEDAAQHGITSIIQPGGSMRDEEVIAAADEHGIAMVLTGMRHFRH